MYGVPFIALASRGGRLADRVGPFRAAFVCLVLVAPLIALYGVFTIPMRDRVGRARRGHRPGRRRAGVPGGDGEACPPERLAAGQGLSGAAGQAGAGVVALLAAPVYESAGPELPLRRRGASTTLALGGIAWRLRQRGARNGAGIDRLVVRLSNQRCAADFATSSTRRSEPFTRAGTTASTSSGSRSRCAARGCRRWRRPGWS